MVGDLDPVAFTVLLRHGYQFKDVAAGPYHGEYTHRLQWYAAMNAKNLGIVNPALDIFRSLGYLTAKVDLLRQARPEAEGRSCNRDFFAFAVVVEKTRVRVKAKIMEPNPKLKNGELDYTETRELTRWVDQTRMVERQPSTVLEAGYALAWYLGDDSAR